MRRLSADELEALINSGNPETLRLVEQYLKDPLNTFVPRPDRLDIPYPDQQSSFFYERFPGVAVLLGGNSSGKSYCAAAKFASFLVDTPPPVDLAKSLVVCGDRKMAGKLWPEYLKQYLENYVDRISWYRSSDELPESILLKPHTKNGHRHSIDFRSHEQGARSFQSYNLFSCWNDEPVEWNTLCEIIRGWGRRWEPYPGSFIYTLTPKHINVPELEELYYSKNAQGVAEDFKFYSLNTECNHYLPDDHIRVVKQANPRDMWPTVLYGQFQHLSGAIFKDFDEGVHVVKPATAPIPSNWHRFRAMDTGGSEEHPTVLLHGARSPEGDRWIVYNEKVWTDEPPSQIAAEIKNLPASIWDQNNRHCKTTFCDPENRPFRNELAAAGIPNSVARKGPNEVWPGIHKIGSFLQHGDDGKPRLQIWDTCPLLIKQMRTYRREPASKRSHRKPILMPLKFDDDAVDALRYMIFSAERKSSLGEIKILPKPDNRRAIFGR